MEEGIFEKCVDNRLLDGPDDYCKKVILPSLDFTLFNIDNKNKACEEAA